MLPKVAIHLSSFSNFTSPPPIPNTVLYSTLYSSLLYFILIPLLLVFNTRYLLLVFINCALCFKIKATRSSSRSGVVQNTLTLLRVDPTAYPNRESAHLESSTSSHQIFLAVCSLDSFAKGVRIVLPRQDPFCLLAPRSTQVSNLDCNHHFAGGSRSTSISISSFWLKGTTVTRSSVLRP